jgi:uncharacterized protein YdeI (YjbR/CyaY-like superfamily)
MSVDPPVNSVHPESRAAWRAWLAANHTRTEGIWLVTYKKATGLPRVDYDEAVEEAICFGWIDSKANTLDDTRSLLWMAPRNAKTGWSRVNKERIERLLALALIAEPGREKINAAKADGSWTLLDGVEALEIPSDLAAALASFPNAAANFDAFPRSIKRGILEWILLGKRAETRAKRIEETARLAEENRRANQWRG